MSKDADDMKTNQVNENNVISDVSVMRAPDALDEVIQMRRESLMSIETYFDDMTPLTESLSESLWTELDQQLAIPAASMDELYARLKVCGQLARKLEETMSKTGIIKQNPISERVIARIISSLIHIKRVGESKNDATPLMWYDFNEGIYREDMVGLRKLINMVEPSLKRSGKLEVIERIEQDAPFVYPSKDPDICVMGNGIYNADTQTFGPFDPEVVVLTKTSVNWNPEAKHPDFPDGWTFDGFLKEQFEGDKQNILMVYQLIQMAILTNRPKNVFVYFYSVLGRTGKGTLTELLRHLVGVNNSGSANIVQLEQQFGLENVYDKAFIFGNENDDVFSRSNVNIKNLASGDTITVNRKGLINLTVTATPLIVQSMNSLPTFNGLDDGVRNRMRVLEFKHSYYGDDNEAVKREYVKNNELLEYLAYTALNLPIVGVADTDASAAITKQVAQTSNPVAMWFEERMSTFTSPMMTSDWLFTDFLAWMKIENITWDISRRSWTEKLIPLILSTFVFYPKNKTCALNEDDKNAMSTNIRSAGLVIPESNKRQSAYAPIINT